jgi:hypothetical protein
VRSPRPHPLVGRPLPALDHLHRTLRKTFSKTPPEGQRHPAKTQPLLPPMLG